MRLRTIHLPLSGLLLAAGLTLTGSLPAEAAADDCAPGVASDFNGDGRSDTVVADPYATVNGQAQAGRVIVLYGDADGLIGEGARGVVYQGQSDASAVCPRPGTGSASPWRSPISTATDYTDLVVGTPYEDTDWPATPATSRSSGALPPVLGTGAASRNVTQTTSRTPTLSRVTSSATPSTRWRTSARAAPRPRTRTRWRSAHPAATSAVHNDAGWVGFLVAFDGEQRRGRPSVRTPPASPARPRPGTASVRRSRSTSSSPTDPACRRSSIDAAVGARTRMSAR